MSETKKNQSSTEKKPVDTSSQNASDNKSLENKIHDVIGPIFKEMNIENGIVIAQMPNSEEVAVYYRGHFYDVATLVAGIHRKFKGQIVQDMD